MLQFDGQNHVFEIAGGPGFPALRDTIQAPSSTIDIISPGAFDTVSKSTGFFLAWTGGEPATQVTIIGNGSQGFGKTIYHQNSLNITSANLAGLAPGPLKIIVAGGNYSGRNSQGIDRMVSMFSTMAVRATLVP